MPVVIFLRTTMTSSPPAETITLWIVDDDPLFREVIIEAVNQSEGIVCERAFGSGEACLEALKRDFAPVVMLMDIVLPGGMDGITCVESVKQISPATEVIMLTGIEEDEKVFKAICAGASGYLLKLSASEIIEAIKDVVAGGRPMNAQIAKKVLKRFAELARPRGDAFNLTGREREILTMLMDGSSKSDIAGRMFLSRFTVETHIKNIYAKLHVHSLGELFSKLYPHPVI